MKNQYILVYSLLIFFSLAGNAQTRTHASNTNAWWMYTGTHKIAKNWSLQLEAQIRSSAFIYWQQLVLRTGINYHAHPNVMLTAGYCYVDTWPYGAMPVAARFPEHRIWEQVQVKNQTGILEWAHRLRIEQRFLYLPVYNAATATYETNKSVYNNRFRVLNRVSIPFRGKTIRDHSLYLSVYDELFINAGTGVANNLLDQNRAYIAIGYKIPVVGRLEIGYLEQTIIKGDGVRIENNHTLQVGLSSSIDFIKKPRKKD